GSRAANASAKRSARPRPRTGVTRPSDSQTASRSLVFDANHGHSIGCADRFLPVHRGARASGVRVSRSCPAVSPEVHGSVERLCKWAWGLDSDARTSAAVRPAVHGIGVKDVLD